MTREEKLQEIIREIFQKVFDGMANPLADGIADIVFKAYELGYNECKSKMPKWEHWKDGIVGNGDGEQVFLIKIGSIYSISSCLGCECDYIELSELDKLMREEKQGKSKWTEEDEENYKDIIGAIHSVTYQTYEDKVARLNWMKSIKQRMEE